LLLANIPRDAWDDINGYMRASREDAYMEALAGALREAPGAARRMEAENIPAQIIRDTFADIGLWARRCKRQQGRWGLAPPATDWLKNHLNCKIFRIGRFQCMPRHMHGDWKARFYRRNADGRVLALTAGDVEFRGDGQVNGTSGVYDDTDKFHGYYKETAAGGGTFAEGVAISPAGYAVNKIVRLDMSEWTPILNEGTPVFELHIPVDGDFLPETCQKTLSGMADFARGYMRAIARLTGVEGPFAAFTLCSWLLNAQLEDMLPTSSNLIRHLRNYYLLPVFCGPDNELFWIFDGRKIDLDNLQPEDTQTSLQRKIIQFMRDGGKVRYNSGVIMLADLPEYGNDFYRNGFDSLNIK